MRFATRTLSASILCTASLAFLAGCNEQSAKANDDDAPAAQSATANYAVGRVTFADGKPITGDVQDISIAIQGVTEAGERVSYTPIVKDGVYKQKLAAGQYSFSRSTIKVKFGESSFLLKLEPVGPNWNKNQDAAEGIVQDFVWKPTGQAETYGAKPDPNNATHWYGMSVGMSYAGYREDLKKPATPVPDGTKMTFTLTPTSKCIDGTDLQPIVVERAYNAKETFPSKDLNDLPPANYDLTGVCTYPDGTSKPIVFQGPGDYPNFVDTGKVKLIVDGLIGGMNKPLFNWGVN
jgi:hypothetical protein